MEELEEYAKINNVPIMQKDGIEFLKKYIKENNISNILEIGTAIGYSAINMCLVNENVKVTTIERNKEMYDKAIENISKYNLSNRITVIYKDALVVTLDDSYDLIFIDAAKSQYINFFNHFSKYLNDGGVVISDNLNFHGLREKVDEIESKNLRSMMKKLNAYIEFLKDLKGYETTFLNIGDGIGVTRKSSN